MRFSTMTLGCKANQCDTGEIESILQSHGHKLVKAGDGSDVCIVNTCAVTTESVRKSRKAIRHIKKIEPNALVAVCGCFPQLEREAATALGADIIGGTNDREAFVVEIENHFSQSKTISRHCESPQVTRQSITPDLQRTRALLKIQDGCDNYCAYCIIPFARGRSRSVPLLEIAEKAKKLSAQGYKEIIITGIEISSYEPGLFDALRIIGDSAPNARLRLGSLHPQLLTDDFIAQLKQIPNLCNHFHISLQNGCDATLKRMERRYITENVYKAITYLREEFENCGITADLIVGFPGETGEEFEQTLSFIERADFSAMHIFPFSPRPGTKAVRLPNQVAGDIKQSRAAIATGIASRMNNDFKNNQIGKTLEVLTETQKEKWCTGHSSNYLTVTIDGNIPKNTLINAKITSVKDNMLLAAKCINMSPDIAK